jgi:hypothetical protein
MLKHYNLARDGFRVEAPITNHLIRDYAPNLEKYKVLQNLPYVGR